MLRVLNKNRMLVGARVSVVVQEKAYNKNALVLQVLLSSQNKTKKNKSGNEAGFFS
jgi:hypothetical protein